MTPYRYVKALPQKPTRHVPIVSFLLLVFGFALLGWTTWPIISFTLLQDLSWAGTVSPVVDESSLSQFTSVVLATDRNASSTELADANTWFPTKPQKNVVAQVNSYTISIPRLGIRQAHVIIGGDDLNVSLIHYGGTGLPGEYGNAVVFGHSTLPQFYKPTSYKTIFSTLPTLHIGDDVYVTYDNVTYKYLVEGMKVVNPTDLSPLEQSFDDSYLTLVTCVPPGTYWERLYVRARLQKI